MCGIFFSTGSNSNVEPDQQHLQNLRARGPDSLETYRAVWENPDHEENSEFSQSRQYLTFVSTVLALRGDHIQAQPLVDEKTGSVLCWNGEAWKVGDSNVTGNDSIHIFRILLAASQHSTGSSHQNIVNLLTSIAGPFAFVFYDAISSNVFFGRDRLGRRSLMISRVSQGSLIISSNSTNTTYLSCDEVSTAGVYRLAQGEGSIGSQLLLWPSPSSCISKVLPCDQATLPTPSPLAVQSLHLHLQDSLRLRVNDISDFSSTQSQYDYSKVAVLFSGGLDCTLLARIADDLLPTDESIDLLNVAFENPRSMAANTSQNVSPYEICPDRITGRSSHAELVKICPNRKWNFVTINIPYSESTQHRPIIVRLMHPHKTEMDLSITMALYFAARGQGVLTDGSHYATAARVLLSGLGADELFAGYTRHATAFSRGGYSLLISELDVDFNRIGSRNLGRDDRVMSHWGREVRYPYLDESFVKFTLDLPAWEKCGFRPGTELVKGDERAIRGHAQRIEDLDPAKMLLRMLAWDLGMPGVATEKKRAIQFGARTAKMDPGKGKKKGTDVVE